MVGLHPVPATPFVPAGLLDNARSIRDYHLRRVHGGPLDYPACSREASEDPSAFALAVLLDMPRRASAALSRPPSAGAWLLLAAVVLRSRR